MATELWIAASAWYYYFHTFEFDILVREGKAGSMPCGREENADSPCTSPIPLLLINTRCDGRGTHGVNGLDSRTSAKSCRDGLLAISATATALSVPTQVSQSPSGSMGASRRGEKGGDADADAHRRRGAMYTSWPRNNQLHV